MAECSTFLYNEAKAEELFSQSFGLPTDIYAELLKSFSALSTNRERSEVAERLYKSEIQAAGLTADFLFISDPNTLAPAAHTGLRAYNEMNPSCMIVYNPEFMNNMDEAHIKGCIKNVVTLLKMNLSGELKRVLPTTNEYSFKGHTYTTSESISTADISDCPPWRQELLETQCKELGIEPTNDLQALTGIEQEKFNKILQVCKVRVAAGYEFKAAARKRSAELKAEHQPEVK